MNVGMNKMSEVMSRNKDDLYQLSQAIITTTVEYLGVAQGAIYLLNGWKASRGARFKWRGFGGAIGPRRYALRPGDAKGRWATSAR